MSRIPFLITIPASPITPTPSMMVAMVIPVNAYPSNTPMMEKKISVSTMNGLLIELNCNTRIRNISPSASNKAVNRNCDVSASCCPCPVCLMVTSDGILYFDLNSVIFCASSVLTFAAMVGSSTFDCNWMVRFTFLRAMAPLVLV